MPSVSNEKDSTVRRVLRALGWWISVPWAVLWLGAGIATALDPSYDMSLIEGLVVGTIVGCLPWWPFWIAQVARRRRAKRAAAEAAAPTAVRKDSPRVQRPAPPRPAPPLPPPPLPPPRHDPQQLAQLPASIRDEWQRLEHARDLVHGFAEDGWVERAALLDVDDHVARLRRLLEADERTNRLGGAASSTLLRQVETLTALLVALADEAVEHQASLADDDPVPVSLAEARERLSASTQAYRELRPLDARPTDQPEAAQRGEQPDASRNLQQPG
jgi:hypothetical protein